MLKVFLILFLVIYLIIVMINMLVKPFMQGYNKQGAGGGDSKGKLIITYNPEKGKKSDKGPSDDYVDYEEVKD